MLQNECDNVRGPEGKMHTIWGRKNFQYINKALCYSKALSGGRYFLKLYNRQERFRQKRFRPFKAISIILKEIGKSHVFYHSVESMADWLPSSDPHQDSNQGFQVHLVPWLWRTSTKARPQASPQAGQAALPWSSPGTCCWSGPAWCSEPVTARLRRMFLVLLGCQGQGCSASQIGWIER